MDETGEWANEVRLVGRVSGSVEERELPSGSSVAALRLVVPRAGGSGRAPTKGAGQGSSATVDTIDVACWSSRTRRTARALADGEVVAVEGALRRRFFRAGGATASRYEVEAASLRRVRG